MPIYTRTGDKGETSLFGGKRVLKCEELVDVYGSIDELNCWIGLVSSKLKTLPRRQAGQNTKVFFNVIQSDLFTIGSTLAGWNGDLSNLQKRVDEMEKRIDEMDRELPVLKNFILPGGSELGALVHIARSICRRVERQTVALFNRQPSAVSPSIKLRVNFQQEEKEIIIKYLNRLSDLFFVLARFINHCAGVKEIVWYAIPRKISK